jgi:hypothetical protein
MHISGGFAFTPILKKKEGRKYALVSEMQK